MCLHLFVCAIFNKTSAVRESVCSSLTSFWTTLIRHREKRAVILYNHDSCRPIGFQYSPFLQRGSSYSTHSYMYSVYAHAQAHACVGLANLWGRCIDLTFIPCPLILGYFTLNISCFCVHVNVSSLIPFLDILYSFDFDQTRPPS